MTKNKTKITGEGSYASINGLKMYYEIHGSGEPLVLLHGALSAIDIDFGRLLHSFAKTRQVIAIEQQAHGHTADIDRPLIYEQMVDDTVALMRHIGIENADIFGYSMGAGIALQISINILIWCVSSWLPQLPTITRDSTLNSCRNRDLETRRFGWISLPRGLC